MNQQLYFKNEFYQGEKPVYILSIKGNYLRHRVYKIEKHRLQYN